ncbi:MAG: helix-turn-helix transcriptional regulator [Clostridia bacterium]
MTINWSLIGKRIRHKRLQHNLTQEQLAEYAYTSNIYICRIERGTANPTLEMLIRLSMALECSISYIIEGNEIQKYDSNAMDLGVILDGCSPYMVRLVRGIVRSIVDIEGL